MDDEPDILEQSKAFLQKEDEKLDVETSISAEKGLELLDEKNYDAIVSDYQMPGMDGLEFLETLREERDSDIPFIVFTGKGREEVAIEALNLGADRYLQKGADPRSQYGILADAIIQEVEYSFLEERLHLASFSLENADVGTLWISPDGEIRYANKQICQWLGYDRGELTGLIVSDIDPNFTSERPEIWEEIKERGSVTFESQHRTKDGETFPVRITSHYLERNGQEYEFAFVHDITEAKEREKELRERRRAVEASDDSIYMIDKDFRYVFANEEHLSRLKGEGKIPRKEENEVVGERYESVHTEEELENFKKNFQEVIESGEPVREEYEIKDAGRWSGRTYSPLKNPKTGEVEGVVVVSKDITDRKEAEERLEREKERYEELFRGANEMIITTDVEGFIKRANKQVEKTSGYSEEELKDESILKIAHPEDKEKYIEFWKRVKDGEEPVYKLKGITKDGETTHLRAAGRPIIKDGEIIEIQYNAQDITEKTEVEEREKFLHSLLRHDVKNKIGIIQGYLELAEDYPLPEESEKHLEKAKKATKDSSELIEKVRTLRRLNQEKQQIIDLEPAVEKAVKKSKPIKREIQIENNLKCPVEGCRVKGGPLLHEIFYNILENSVKHSGGNKVKITNRETEDEMIFTIEDNGEGIPDEEKQKIFEKGYTKDKKTGAGLGLYLAKEIVKTYDGRIEIKDSELGGAKFEVHFQKA